MIFFDDDISFSLNVAPFRSLEDIKFGLWLVLVGINETPPHIALISEGKYYSLSTRKVDCGGSLEKFINTLERKHIPSLFVNIKTTGQSILLLENIYKDLQPLVNTENTCLYPIKQLFMEFYSPDFSGVNYVFELLAVAEKKKLIGECMAVFHKNTNSNIITLPKYSMSQIRNNIHALSSQFTSLK